MADIIGTPLDDILVGTDLLDTISGLAGNDNIEGRGGNDTISGGDGDDFLKGDGGDAYTGPSGNDTLLGGLGNDNLRGGAGVDFFDGGDGIDRASFFVRAATQGVVASLLSQTISNDGFGNAETMVSIESLGGGTAFADTFTGNNAANLIIGGIGDTLTGMDGDDTFELEGAPLTLNGGLGVDSILSFNDRALVPDGNDADSLADFIVALKGVTVDLTLGSIVDDGYGNSSALISIENVGGGALADKLIGDLNANSLQGLGGADNIEGRGGNDIIDGGAGDDFLKGDGDTAYNGPSGNDTLFGGTGDDVLRGGAGVDTLDGGIDIDRASFFAQAATQGAVVSLLTQTVTNDGFGNAETLVSIEGLGGGTAFVDSFTGDDNGNTILAGLGDIVLGLGGDDVFQLEAATATLDGGDGNDTLESFDNSKLAPDANADGLAEIVIALQGVIVDLSVGAIVNDGHGGSGVLISIENLGGGALADQLTGDDAANTLQGFDGNDILSARAGADVLDGGAGRDTLDGGLGADILLGGTGSDTYVVDDIGDLVIETSVLGGVDLVQSSLTYTLGFDLENLTLTGLAALDGTGNTLGNTLTGNEAANRLLGLGGADTLRGLAGDDTLIGGAGADLLDGDLGRDTVSYVSSAQAVAVNLELGAATGGDAQGDTFIGIEDVAGSALNDTLIGDPFINVLAGLAGADVLDGGLGTDTADYSASGAGVTVSLVGGAGVGGDAQGDTLANFEFITGSGFNDTLTGDAFVNALAGLAGNDTLDGGAGADGLIGGAGDDTYITDTDADVVTELAGEGTDLVQTGITWFLSAEVENLTLTGVAAVNGSGNELANVIVGNGAVNSLFGNAGNDTLDGAVGADRMFGGAGDDIYFVSETGDVTFEGSALDGTDTVVSSVTRTLGANLENLTLIGVAATGGGNTLNNIITGNNAANTLSGNAGDDTLSGGGGADVLQGGDGADALNGGAGADNMFGGAGNDTYTVDSASDVTGETSALDGTDTVFSSVTRTLGANLENLTLTGAAAITGAGNSLANVLIGNDAANTLFGNDGDDTLIGGGGVDVLQGGAGADVLDGGTGADKMFGGAGNDTYVVDNAGDVTFEGSALDGVDLVQSSVARNLGANLENLTLTGSAAIDGVGNSLANIVNGNSGGNSLFGNGGNDTLNGAAGDDTLSGAAGNDAFVFAPGSGQDRVTDFVAGGVDDTLNLSAYNGTGITWTITQVGADTVFDFSNGDQITLTNVIAANLVQTDPFGYS